MTVTPSPTGEKSCALPGTPDSYADVVERLFAEFTPRHSLSDIAAIVGQCRAELSCSPALALPELIERLARVRLSVPPL